MEYSGSKISCLFFFSSLPKGFASDYMASA